MFALLGLNLLRQYNSVRQGEEYKLLWKPTVDFVRMASRFDTIIVPFATLGGDDAYVYHLFS